MNPAHNIREVLERHALEVRAAHELEDFAGVSLAEQRANNKAEERIKAIVRKARIEGELAELKRWKNVSGDSVRLHYSHRLKKLKEQLAELQAKDGDDEN